MSKIRKFEIFRKSKADNEVWGMLEKWSRGREGINWDTNWEVW